MARRRDGLAARREALGFTQEALAQQLGVEFSTVGRWERGTLTPQPWRRRHLAKALELSLQELDELLNPPEWQTGSGFRFTTRREVMVDAALVASVVMADRMLGAAQDAASPDMQTEPASHRITIPGTAALVTDLHRTYQAAQYSEVARRLPTVTATVDELVAEIPPSQRREALNLQTSLAVVAAKLATKSGDADAALGAAEQARLTAEAAEDTFGRAAAAYQRACALLRAGHAEDAEQVAIRAVETLHGTDPHAVTWRGALTLISAIIAARRDDPTEAHDRLDHASRLARQLGADANIGWTAFGPTNVLIHRVSAAVALTDPRQALTVAEQLDITRIPATLAGRQAQYDLDSAWAHTQLGEDPSAVIHLLDTERVAPELVRANPNARTLIADLLSRERRRVVPGLRGLSVRAGVAA